MIRRLFDALRTGGMSERRPRHISDGLALAIAGQVAVGLALEAETDEARIATVQREYVRAATALTAIGRMIENATDNEHVHETLLSIDNLTIRHEPGGGVTLLRHMPREPGSE